MGLSASQARLLSITKRLSNNELASEIIAKNKLALAGNNTIARDKYIQALDSTKMEYVSYNGNGIQDSVALTFNSINTYSPLKNQYQIRNSEGQVMVNRTDAANFNKSNSLYEFLACYGLFDGGLDDFNKRMAEYDAQMRDYSSQMDKYNAEKAEFEKEQEDYANALNAWNERYNAYQDQLNKYNADYEQYLKDLEEYEKNKNLPHLYNDFTNAVINNSHYSAAKYGDPGCFLHVLNKFFNYDGVNNSSCGSGAPYMTSVGVALTSDMFFETEWYDMPELKPIQDAMRDYESDYVCDGIDVGTDGTKNLYEVARENGVTPSIYEKLVSDFIEIDNGDGTYEYQKKTLMQKTIDMYYVIANSTQIQSSRGFGPGTFTIANVSELLTNFVEGDMRGLDPEEPEEPKFDGEPPEPFDEEPPKMKVAYPTEPEKPVYTEKILDKPLAQWYTNLWYAMDGSDLSDALYSIYDENADFDYFTVPNNVKASNEYSNYYKVINDDLASDSNWLQFALTNGLVTLSHAGLRTDNNIRWEGIEFSSTSDIREVEDSAKIAKAEAEYTSSLKEIEAQDKQYDLQLKKLDTEHTELKQEVESIKNVMSKNVERSFTVFS